MSRGRECEGKGGGRVGEGGEVCEYVIVLGGGISGGGV